MDRKAKVVRLLTWTLVLVLTVVNCTKIVNHTPVSLFGYLSYIFNVLALLAVVVDYGNIKNCNKPRSRTKN